ncbi:MAG: SAM-dependent methyltransferase [Acidibrevibacterium sp.]|jgi:SAM-dependent MidA family methyltransferase|uniref:class I SAM-dependent methyltransferase n=1 Tax=Acidibrevibacterium fodinaquatile TaxID=1969806 RepID=UPI0023A86FE8|nr:SAM-dependent methyltransferase [Acidibrevibacterium fodinaquatile]MCA7119315.1 SAM-dependent methyltransferase [Acidibrevibacterium fodinaquatile]
MERLDHFMAAANALYYARRDPFADFTTAPEISQVFGELLGLWAAETWRLLGRPDPVLLAEAGPGRGTLMADAQRAIAAVTPDFAAALRLHLIETSPRLRALQAAKLPGATWHETFATLPPGPLILLANEFLDALPIRQFVRRGGGWAERHVAGAAFVEIACPDPPALLSDIAPPALAEGAVMEVAEAARGWVTALSARIAADGGAALLIDYGPAQAAAGDSLQALRHGRPAPPLASPGEADLTAHVAFAPLADAARAQGTAVFGPLAQGVFLARLGLFARSGQLARNLPPKQAAAVIAAAQRLAEPDRMGLLFKALAIMHAAAPPPPGFAM